MEGLEFLVLTPIMLALFSWWTALLVNRKIGTGAYFGVLIGVLCLGCLGLSGEAHYILKVEALEQAAIDGNAADEERLLAAGANPNEADDEGMYPLQLAVANNHPEAVMVLLKYYANPNVGAGIEDRRSLVRYAADEKLHAILQMLKKAGGRP